MVKVFFKKVKDQFFNHEETIDDEQIKKARTQAENMDEEEIQSHGKHFSFEDLWKKIQKFAKKSRFNSYLYCSTTLLYTPEA